MTVVQDLVAFSSASDLHGDREAIVMPMRTDLPLARRPRAARDCGGLSSFKQTTPRHQVIVFFELVVDDLGCASNMWIRML